MKQDILRALKSMPIIDSHEHLPHEKELLAASPDVLSLMTPYVCDNLMTCGMAESAWRQANDTALPLADRYALISPYLPYIRHTTYFKSMMRGAKLCYGMKDFTLAECERVNALMAKGLDTAALFREHGIRRALTFVGYGGLDYFSDSAVLTPVPTVSLITPRLPSDVSLLSSVSGVEVTNTDTLRGAIRSLFARYSELGLRNIKLGGSYNRVPDYREPRVEEAEEQLQAVRRGDVTFPRVLGENNPVLPLEGLKALDDLVVHTCVELAGELGMNTVIHTGIHAWNKNNPKACHAEALTELIAAHDGQSFTLLHLGYPHIGETLLLCKYFRQVSLDLAWLHILDRRVAVDTVKRVIELLPTNKIVGFGGDVCLPVNTVGNLEVSLENLAEALADLVTAREMTAADAEELAYAWLYENPGRIYGLNA